ncbi:MAG: hypothetical protein K0S92_1649 [Desertimonas sp.]|jgi:hypothetical protein|nr:hypothetical protein [Desertimonas sp.]
MTDGISYLRGAFIAYEPGGYPDRKRVIPFRFNPEALSRTVALQTGQSGGGVEGAAPRAAAAPPAEGSADASAGTIKESFTVQIRLDFADRDESVSGLDEEFGIAPEIAAIEDLLYPAEAETDASSDGSEPVRPARARPTVLFVWGRKRVLPVKVVSLKIDESVYNNHLNPVRAEIDVSLEVHGEADARNDPAVRSALDHTNASRRELARMYYDNTSSQGSNILPL